MECDTYVSAIVELGKIESGSGGDDDVVEGDGRAAGLVLDSRGSVGKGAAASTGIESRMRKSGSHQATEEGN